MCLPAFDMAASCCKDCRRVGEESRAGRGIAVDIGGYSLVGF